MMQNFVNLLVALRRLPPLGDLTGDEERLLFEIKALCAKKDELFLKDIYNLLANKSASTTYRNFKGLERKGFIEIAVDDADGRMRRVTLTAPAETLFAKLKAQS